MKLYFNYFTSWALDIKSWLFIHYLITFKCFRRVWFWEAYKRVWGAWICLKIALYAQTSENGLVRSPGHVYIRNTIPLPVSVVPTLKYYIRNIAQKPRPSFLLIISPEYTTDRRFVSLGNIIEKTSKSVEIRFRVLF
jgi:hypothetical protein